MKVCSKCHIEKDESEFNKKAKSKDGLCCQCKKCVSEYYNSFYTRNHSAILEHKRSNYKYKDQRQYLIKYYKRKVEEDPEYNKKYYQKNQERILKLTKLRSDYKRDYQRPSKKEWNKNNRTKILVSKKKYNDKSVNELLDTYIVGGLIKRGFPKDFARSRDLIELKKDIIKTKRLCKNKDQSRTCENSGTKWPKSLPHLKMAKLPQVKPKHIPEWLDK